VLWQAPDSPTFDEDRPLGSAELSHSFVNALLTNQALAPNRKPIRVHRPDPPAPRRHVVVPDLIWYRTFEPDDLEQGLVGEIHLDRYFQLQVCESLLVLYFIVLRIEVRGTLVFAQRFTESLFLEELSVSS